MIKVTNSFQYPVLQKAGFKILLFVLVLWGSVAVLHAQAHDLQKKVSITLRNTSAETVIKELNRQTAISFTYDKASLEGSKISIIDFKGAPLSEVLRFLRDKEGLEFTVLPNTIVVRKSPKPKAQVEQSSEPLTVKGRVFDTNEPPGALPGVSVIVKGTDRGTVTDIDGNFSIKVRKGEVLTFSMVSFVGEEYTVQKNESNFVLSLREDVAALNEVVVVGLSEQKKRHIASSIATLDVASNIVGKPITTLSQSLQGGVTGLQVTQSSGLPGGDAAAIKIRGVSTLGNSNPLVLVDGVPMDMNHIDPVTVESVTVLKDAAAAAIYGARAANGVILVTTKRGVPGKVTVGYDGFYGVQSPTNLPEVVDAPTYMSMYNEGQLNAGQSPNFTEEDIQLTRSGADPVKYPNTNWRNLMINRAAPITSHSLSLSGGNSLARFAVTANYMDQEGMLPNTSMSRFNIRANSSFSLSDKFLVNLDLLAIRRNTSQPNKATRAGGSRLLEDIYRVPPTILPRYPAVNGVSHYGHYVDIVNPLAFAERGGAIKAEDSQTSLNLQPKWEVFPNFNLNGQFSFRLNSDANRTTRENTNFFDYYTGQLLRTWDTQREASMDRTTYYYMAANADYTLDLDDHYIFAMAGYSQEENNRGDWNINSMVSAYAKLNYSFKDRYLLEGTIRMDGSSKFGPGHKFGYFPSAAVGWNIHNESFLQGVDVINNLKLRASYGQLGNENIGLYRYQTIISPSNGLESTYGNPGITWETVNMFNVGLDIGLFHDNKVELIVDVYDKRTKDIILSPLLPDVGGFQGEVPINAGEVRNRGWEASLNYNDKISNHLSFSVRPGVTYNSNEITYLVPNFVGTTSTTINEVGGAIGSIYGYRTNGLLQESDFDAEGNPLVPLRPDAAPGDIKYLDLNGDGVIDATNDQTRIGNPVPRLNYFSNFQIAYRNFDFEFLLQGTGKSDVPLTGMFALPLDMSRDGGVPTTYYAGNYWTPQRTNARFPRISTSPINNRESSDFWFQNGAYLRVKYVQLGYNLQPASLARLGVSNARLYVNAQNPLTFTSLKLTDPESRGNQWTYSIMEVYTVGLSVRF
ncbi:SusC/RagA family TonB-linked outer membrane protein [Rufibacter psychrotolerans]|uniref:SusC/RagA family TonB-linked outer membrane protein n=1 Tax=Rufibacter psychrotolerans TaxID=2812556 RepID=UPI00196794B4|nr:TonB-dependent receptor [Rufibacter sp. SYSU D00308]